jgi:tRNA pseudouridine32 synthase/23S rRNA pseudouridine746 synthase
MSLDLLDHWIHYIDDDFVVVNKPPGLPSVPGRTPSYSDNLYHLLQSELPPIYVVHRLDINTSGLILFARTYDTQRYLNRLFRQRLVKKYYLAQIEGQLAAHCGDINLPIISDWLNRPKQKLCFSCGKPSMTQFRRLQVTEHHTLVQLMPITGRSHQLRIHTSLIGHPIVGCKLYGNGHANSRLMLHAYRLSFPHPRTQQAIEFCSFPEFATFEQLATLNLK